MADLPGWFMAVFSRLLATTGLLFYRGGHLFQVPFAVDLAAAP